MKKTLLLLGAAISLAASQISAQTITVTGSSHTVNPGDVFNVSISLSVSQPLPSNVTALNLLLATPSSGATSGAPYFTVQFDQGGPDFPNRIGPGGVSTFNTTGSGANAGWTVSDPTEDLGASGSTGVTAPFSDVLVSILNFTVDPSTPVGTYDFRATLGWDVDFEGSFINDANNSGPEAGGTYAVNNAPVFTVTVVPEPSTWALIVVGGIASLGMTMFRRRRS